MSIKFIDRQGLLMTSLLNFTIYIYKLKVWILSLLICQLDHFFAALSCFTLLQIFNSQSVVNLNFPNTLLCLHAISQIS